MLRYSRFLAKVYFFQMENKKINKLVKENVFFYQMIYLPRRLDNRNIEKNAEENKKGTLNYLGGLKNNDTNSYIF